VILLFAVSPSVGYAPLDIPRAVRDIFEGNQTLAALVLRELRFPRALLGGLVGFSLGMTGAAMHGLLRNALAEPGIIGVSGAASFGAVLTFYYGRAGAFSLALPLGGIAGVFAATFVLFVIAGRGARTMTLILAGITINSFTAALTALALNLSANPFALNEIVFWLMGSFADRGLPYVWLVLPMMAIGWGLAGAAFAVGSAVAVTGVIGFVGLVVPHVLRPFVAHRPGRLLLASGLGSAALTLAADISVRVIPVRPELKLGVVTALIGAPFLFSLIYRLRRDG
jgi:iron complex transport system permease protein